MAKPSGFTYSTTEFIKFTLGAEFNTDDEDIWRIHKNASALVSGYVEGRIFVPCIHTGKYDETHAYDLKTLVLRDDVLAVTAITNGNGVAIAGGDWTLLPEDEDPKCQILLDSADWEFTDLKSRIAVVGTFGYSDNYAEAWGDSLDTLAVAIGSTTATTITVNNADGPDDRAETRFEIGDYLLIDSEQMQVRDIDTVTNILTVMRGVNNTTAATHLITRPISVWRQNEDVKWATTHIAVWLYKNKDTVNQVFSVPGGEERVGGIAKEVWERLDKFKREMRRES